MEIPVLKNIAVLIDADNASHRDMEDILNRISLYGHISLKRAYGNWFKDQLNPWQEVMTTLAIKPMQQIDYVAKKNATDMALTIDGMDLLHSGKYDGFALVSSDSDFTPLALRIRETGATVIVAGKDLTPISLKNACDFFIRVDLPKPAQSAKQGHGAEPESDLGTLLKDAYVHYCNDEGFAYLSSAGNYILRAKPDFDITDYGYHSLLNYLESFPRVYEIVYSGDGPAKIILYRVK